MLPGRERILYWPFALSSPALDTASDWLAENLARYDYAGTFETWTTLRESDHSELYEFDLLFVGGGNTFQLLNEIQTYGFLEPVRTFVQRGGAYYGGSAGAVIACDDIAIAQGHDPNDVGLSDLRSLGLIRHLAVLPHYLTTDMQAAQQWAQDHRTRLVGLPERTGLVVTPTTTLVVGQEPAWTFDRSEIHRHSPGTALPAKPRGQCS
jgi:dipeptidase E